MAVTAGPFALWREILSVARHAPSPHNVQPWRIKLLSDREAELYIDGARTLPKEDFTGSFLLSAMGMFIEAINLLAAPHGMCLEYRLHQSADWFAARACADHVAEFIPFAYLQLVDSATEASPYSPSLFLKRRTCRISLHTTPVAENAVAALSALAQDRGHCYLQTDTPQQIDRILARNIDAVFHDMNVAGYHDEITSWFRFTDRTALQHRDGLDWRCMNLSRSEFWLSARLPRLLLFPLTRALFKARYRQQLGVVPAIGMLSGKFFVAENAVESGRFLMRFWLETARLGLYLHPYGNLVTNDGAAAWLRHEVKLDNIWLVFKLGYADEPPQSYRRELEDILVS
jgi:nitroreductase